MVTLVEFLSAYDAHGHG